MSNRSTKPGVNSRALQMIACIQELERIKATSPQPAKILKYEFAQKYPDLRQREHDVIFAAVFNRARGRPRKIIAELF
jgi:hypothetical protein